MVGVSRPGAHDPCEATIEPRVPPGGARRWCGRRVLALVAVGLAAGMLLLAKAGMAAAADDDRAVVSTPTTTDQTSSAGSDSSPQAMATPGHQPEDAFSGVRIFGWIVGGGTTLALGVEMVRVRRRDG